MPFTEVWAHADSYPHSTEQIGRLRNCNNMGGYMMTPLNYMNASRKSGSNFANSTDNKNEILQEKTAYENLKRHGTAENITAKRSAYDFLINNVEYADSNMRTLPQSVNVVLKNTGKKRTAVDETEVDSKRFCMKQKDDQKMEIDGQLLQTYQDQTSLIPEDINLLPATQATPIQDYKYQAQNNPVFSVNCGSGHDSYIWPNNIQKSIVNNSIISKNTFYGSLSHSNKVELFEINSSEDDVEFMYQATHGGNLMRHESRHLGDDL